MRRNRLVTFAGPTAIFIAVLAVASSAGRAETVTTKAEEEIKRIELERNEAILAGDSAALDRMTSDDYTFITQRGELRTKAEIVAGFKASTFKYSEREISDLTIRVYGNAAVVTGRARQKGNRESP